MKVPEDVRKTPQKRRNFRTVQLGNISRKAPGKMAGTPLTLVRVPVITRGFGSGGPLGYPLNLVGS